MSRSDPTINQGNSPPNLRMTDFISKFNQLQGPAKACRFGVQINPASFIQQRLPTNDLIYMCDSAQFPGRGFGVTEIRYYGPSRALPNNSEYETASFTFICNQKSRERYYFDEWMNIINPVDNFNFEYANNYCSDIKVYQFAEYSTKDQTRNGFGAIQRSGGFTPFTQRQEQQLNADEANKTIAPQPQNASGPDIIYGWTLRNAWPILVAPQQVTWQDQDILRLQVTFTYRYWDRKDFMN